MVRHRQGRKAARFPARNGRTGVLVNLWVMRMTTLADIDQLADAIAALVLSRARIPSDFWDYDDIAYHLRASKSTAMKWATLPDFPKPIRPPADGYGKGHPRFLPAEVRKWAMSHKEGAPGRVGRPRKETA